MKNDPILFQIPLADFDLSLLPIDPNLLRSNPDLMRDAVVQHLADRFRPFGGQTNIAVQADQVSVSWIPESGKDSEKLLQYAVKLLHRRAFAEAESILRGLLKLQRPPTLTEYNLGMLLSEQGRIDEALELLESAVSELPNFADGWNALGIALQRKGDTVKALAAVERSYEIDSENPYTLRNLGALLANGNPAAGLPYLKRATELLPKDPVVAFGYGKALLDCGQSDVASAVFEKVITLAPYTEVGERARTERTKLAENTMREHGGTVRMDVVLHLAEAIKQFGSMELKEIQSAVYEIAMLGSKGLDINNPDSRYTLQSIPGSYSGLRLLAYLFAGTQIVAPGRDVGIDFSAEYTEAKRISGLGL